MRLDEMLLYRGDRDAIAQFDVGKTHVHGLFGPGIYLTSDPGVAHDYTTTGRGDHNVFPLDRFDPESFNTKDLLRNYVKRLASQFDEKEFQDEWVRSHGLGSFYSGLSDKLHRDLNHDMELAKRRSITERWQDALNKVRAQLPTLRVVKLTTGEVRLVRKDRPAAISVFDVPDDYVARTLHADRPISNRVLKALRKIWLQSYTSDRADLRDADGNMVNFDTYIRGYRERGTRYAWRDEGDDEWWRGGKGENPTLDDLWNGTYSGNYVFADSMFDKERPKSDRLIRTLTKLGYVGLEYDGGKRVGANVRGGGGVQHRAFVFWDAAAINGFHRTNAPLPSGKRMTLRSLP